MIDLLTELMAPGRFYPLFFFLVAVWLGVRHRLRRRMGPATWEARTARLEQILLSLLLLGMLALAVLQILLRNFFSTGLIWIEPLARHLVLWIGFAGAVVAAGQLRHIQMDVLSRLLPERGRLWMLRLTTMIAGLVCAVLARAAGLYLLDEAAFGSTGFLGIPTWVLTSVIFVGFAVIAARFASRALDPDAQLATLERRTRGAQEPSSDRTTADERGA
ncbi:MAG: TRAP transporter small permease subunit [Candidatus Eisenbacteria bacterium]|nr:TRAP transporter small permease subunit [Candidatus Eisenbacteria bacterium]